MRPLRIALYHNLPSGGAKRLTFELIRRLTQRGHAVVEFTLSSADLNFMSLGPYVRSQYIYDAHPIRWFQGRIPLLTPYIHAIQGMLYQHALNKQAAQIAHKINNMEFDLAFVEDCQFTTIPFILQHLSVPTVFYLNSLPFVRQPKSRVNGYQNLGQSIKAAYYTPAQTLHEKRMRHIDMANLKAAQVVLINSDFSAQWVEQHYGIRSQVVYPGVDVEKFRPLGLPRDDYLLAVGSISKGSLLTGGKGYPFMIEALSYISDNRRPKLIIASNFSDPLEKQLIVELAAIHGVALEIRSVWDDNELIRLYNQAQMLLFTPHNEPLGLVALEALACGTPVVGVKEGGVCETIIDGQTGLLEERNPEAFAQAVMRVLMHPAERDRMGKAGVEYIRSQWTWDRAIDYLENIFAAEVSKRSVSLVGSD